MILHCVILLDINDYTTCINDYMLCILFSINDYTICINDYTTCISDYTMCINDYISVFCVIFMIIYISNSLLDIDYMYRMFSQI